MKIKKYLKSKIINMAKWCWATLPRRIISCLVIASILLSSFWYLFLKPQPVEASWWDEDWLYRMKLTVDSTKVDAELANLPVLIKLTSTQLTFSKAQSLGQDIRFTDNFGNSLKYEIERWDSANSLAEVWVKLPTVYTGTATYFYMYYGNAAATDGQDKPSVWSDGFKAVWHLDEAASPGVDSTGGNNASQAGSVTWAQTGQINKSVYTANVGYLDIGNVSDFTDAEMTISFWHNTNLDAWRDLFAVNTASGENGFVIEIGSSGYSYVFPIGSFTMGGSNASSVGVVATNGWRYMSTTLSSGTNKSNIYDNGVVGTAGTWAPSTSSILSINFLNGSWRTDRYIKSYLDEIRISNVARSAAWVKADYNSVANTLLTYGSEEKGSGPVLFFRFDEGYGTTAKDSSEQNNDGTITNATWTDSGKFGKALSFDGTGDYVQSGDAPALDISGTQGVSISAWVKLGAYPSASNYFTPAMITETGYGGGTYDKGIEIDSSGKAGFYVYDVGTKHVLGTTALKLGTWYYLTGVYDGTTIVIYVNGVQEGSLAAAYTYNFTTPQLVVGFGGVANRSDYNGKIDEVKVYPYARTAAQVKKDYDRGSAVNIGGDNSWIEDGLVGYWKMNEASWNGTSGQVIDSSGVGNNATSAGNATTAAGKFGMAGTFDGTGDSVGGTLPGTCLTNNRTVVAWIKTSVANGGIVSRYSDAGGFQYKIYTDANGNAYFGIGESNTANGVQVNSSTVVTDGAWHQIIGTYDLSNVRIYVDGIQKNSAAATYSTPTCGYNFCIGVNSYDCTGNGHNGLIDDVRIYNRALSSTEVQKLYNWGPGPIGEWKMEEGSGSSLQDTTENANTGTITGATWKNASYCHTGSCLSFDGDGDYVDLVPFAGGWSAATVSAWVYTTKSLNGNTIFAFSPSSGFRGDEAISLKWSGSYDLLSFTVYNQAITGASHWEWVTPNNWYHVVGVYDGAQVKLYLNGKLGTTNAPGNLTGNVRAGTDRTTIGINTSYTAATSWDGIIDDVKIYDYALTSRQIAELYTNSGPNQGKNPVNSTVGYWKFDEGAGATAYDSSGNSNNGTITGATTTMSGKYGKALSFDNSDDKVEIADSASLRPDYITASAWVKATSWAGAGSYDQILEKADSSNPWTGYSLRDENGELEFGVYVGSANYFATWTSTVPSAGVWHHIVGSYDGEVVKLYVDGILRAINSDPSGVMVDSSTSTTLRIGEGTAATGRVFNGLIDEVKIFPFAMTQDDILMEYNNGKAMQMGSNQSTQWCPPGFTGTCTAPVAEWKMNENSGTSLQDTSANTNTGTISGATWKNASFCKTGSCLNFDGNDYINVGNATSLRITESISFSIWVKTTSTNMAILGGRGSPNSGYYIGLHGTESSPDYTIEFCYFGAFCSNSNGSIVTPYNYFDDKWHHIVVVYNKTNVKYYIDSTLVYTDSQTLSGVASATSVYLGGYNDYYTYGSDHLSAPYTGNLDETKIFDYALTQEQVSWLYNKGKPIGYWKMDEGQGATIKDSSANNNSGTITGATWTSSGKFNSALSFDGNDYVALGTPTSLDLTSQMTLSAWVNLTSLPTLDTWSTVVEKGWDGSKEQFWLSFKNTSGVQSIQWYSYDGSYHGMNFIYTITTGVWHHLVANWDGASWNLYIDGALVNSVSDATGPTHTAKSIQIGAANISDSITRFFNGKIDEVKIYNYALTADQVKLDYNQGSALRF